MQTRMQTAALVGKYEHSKGIVERCGGAGGRVSHIGRASHRTRGTTAPMNTGRHATCHSG